MTEEEPPQQDIADTLSEEGYQSDSDSSSDEDDDEEYTSTRKLYVEGNLINCVARKSVFWFYDSFYIKQVSVSKQD